MSIAKTRRLAITLLAICGILLIAASVGVGVKIYLSNTTDDWQNRVQEDGIDTSQVTPEMQRQHSVSDKEPRYLSIPKLGLSHIRVFAVGLTSPNHAGEQQIDAPRNIHDVGWFNCTINDINHTCGQAAYPDQRNTQVATVIDGHSCNRRGCVFDRLSDLAANDKIILELGNGNTIEYNVVQQENISLAEFNSDKLLQPITPGKAGLNLITCAGRWVTHDTRGRRSMDQRIIVYAASAASNKQL